MPHFATQDTLKAYLHSDQVTQILSKIPEAEREKHYTYADELITNASGIQPQETNNPIRLENIAARIVIWFLSGIQQWNDQNRPELERRKQLYLDALEELHHIKSGDITLTPQTIVTTSMACSDGRRTGVW